MKLNEKPKSKCSVSNNFEMRLKFLHSNIEKFYSVANLGDMSAAYRNRSIWTGVNVFELVSVVENLLVEVPALKYAIFNFISNMAHEATHLHLLQRENSLINIKFDNLEKTVCILVDKMVLFSVELGSQAFMVDMINWLFQFFSDLAQQNALRPAMSSRNIKAIVLLNVFLQCPCTKEFINLFTKAFSNLLKTTQHKAVEIFVESANYGEKSDWFWIYVSDTFSYEITKDLMKIGINICQTYCSDLEIEQLSKPRIVQLQEECNFKLRSFILFFTQLAKKQNSALQSCIFHIVQCFFEKNDVPGMLFLIMLFLSQFEIFEFVIDDLMPFVSTYSILQIISLSQNSFLQIVITSKQVLLNFLRLVALKMKTNTAVILSEAILPIVYDENVLKRLPNLNESFCNEVRETLQILLV